MTTSLPVNFTATIEKSPSKGGWTYVVWPESASFFGTRGLVKVEASVDGVAMTGAFMPLGDGRHKLPIKGDLLKALGKSAGDAVDIRVTERLPPAVRKVAK